MPGKKGKKHSSQLKKKSHTTQQEEQTPVNDESHADSIIRFDSVYILKKTAKSSYAEVDLSRHKSNSDMMVRWSQQSRAISSIYPTDSDEILESGKLTSKSSLFVIPTFSSSSLSTTSNEFNFAELSQMEAIGVISALETCVNQLNILAHTNMKPTVMPDLDYKTLKERFGDGAAKDVLIDVETDLPSELGVQLFTVKKIQEDRAFLEMVMTKTLQELKMSGTYGHLSTAVIQELLVNYEEEELLLQQQENNAEVVRLRKMINTEGSNIQNQIHKADESIAKMKDEIHDNMVKNDLEIRYINNWEHARAEQQRLKFAKKERELHDELVATKISIEMETRVNHEVQDFINEAEEMLHYEIERWSHKYTRELEAKNIELEMLNTQRETHKKKLIALTNLYQERETEIQEYLEIQEKKRAIEAHEHHLNSMATRIQAWWKGVMVRRGLGPYRKKRKGKEKGKKGKGGKKK